LAICHAKADSNHPTKIHSHTQGTPGLPIRALYYTRADRPTAAQAHCSCPPASLLYQMAVLCMGRNPCTRNPPVALRMRTGAPSSGRHYTKHSWVPGTAHWIVPAQTVLQRLKHTVAALMFFLVFLNGGTAHCIMPAHPQPTSGNLRTGASSNRRHWHALIHPCCKP
jgi:hypothetical protein